MRCLPRSAASISSDVNALRLSHGGADEAGHRPARSVLPRCGTGARNGASVSTRRRSSGRNARRPRTSSAFLNVTMPRDRDERAAVETRPRFVGAAGEAVDDRALRHALGVEHVEASRPTRRGCARRARGRVLWPTRSGAANISLLRVGRRVVVEEVEPALADRHDAFVLRGSGSPSRPSFASCGCRPTVAHTSSLASAAAMAVRDVSAPVPMVTNRATPAARAASNARRVARPPTARGSGCPPTAH